ncbi:MAG TPA: TonB family protein [Bacteroidales bacterium]|nr:TonB family protein [Bacteroidales bacterium]HRZ49502.1 TonB family protein [Bacteroidales bacterium]
MTQPKKPRKEFLKLPSYPGGKKAFDLFVKENLRYPEEALQNRIEGDVYVTYEVNDNGEVLNPLVRHGLGFGCDQEALRLISLLHFAKTSNRGVRVKSRFNTRIPFRIPKQPAAQVQLNYSVTPATPPQTPKTEEKSKGGYTWQIPITPDQ